MKEGDEVRYVGPNYPELLGKVGKVFRAPLRELGTISIVYGSEHYELMVDHLELVE